jgi:hypothetical protein
MGKWVSLGILDRKVMSVTRVSLARRVSQVTAESAGAVDILDRPDRLDRLLIRTTTLMTAGIVTTTTQITAGMMTKQISKNLTSRCYSGRLVRGSR